ncbi:MAG TPA: hypothetical protein DSN98_09290 [Thermoplasmata archaeon]|nr:MAG TPA: hypothetical protein DSN98_09290 [Thermoplasmata archaeon]
MRIVTKLFILLFIGVIAVVLLNVLINANAKNFLIKADDPKDLSSVSASPTLLAPIQEPDAGTVSGQNYNCVIYLLGLIGLIGIMAIGINYVKRDR